MSGLFTYLAPAFYDSLWPVRYLFESANRHKIPLTLYGLNEPYKDWFDVQVTRLMVEIEKAKTTHILYTDASDAIFLADEAAIEAIYLTLGSPELLISAEPVDGGLCAGGWLAEKQVALGCLTILRDMEVATRNPQERWREAFESGAIIIDRDEIDYDGNIFGITGCDLRVDTLPEAEWPFVETLSKNGLSSLPCLLHFAGGYTSPTIGKADQIEPLWKELGYEPTVSADGQRNP